MPQLFLMFRSQIIRVEDKFIPSAVVSKIMNHHNQVIYVHLIFQYKRWHFPPKREQDRLIFQNIVVKAHFYLYSNMPLLNTS